jgi:ribosomal protein S6
MEETTHSADAEFTQASSKSADKSAGVPPTDTRPIYEIGYHLVPTLAEDAVAGEVAKIRAMLGDAEIITDEAPKKMTLSYIIERPGAGRREKYGEAYFGFIKFAIDKEHINDIETKLRAMREVLRYLLVQTVREEVAPARRAVFTSDRLEGETLKKPVAEPEKPVEVSEEELDKSIDAIVI